MYDKPFLSFQEVVAYSAIISRTLIIFLSSSFSIQTTANRLQKVKEMSGLTDSDSEDSILRG